MLRPGVLSSVRHHTDAARKPRYVGELQRARHPAPLRTLGLPGALMQAFKSKAETLREEIKRRAGTAKLAWQKLTAKKPREVAPISAQPNIS